MRTLALTIALSVVLVVPALDADHPSIVFIMSDDHAVHAIGAYAIELFRQEYQRAIRYSSSA